ncbi:MAG TPA: divalent-cation tolerance protein CutA [Leptolyngbyaceae cyanobacterium]
MSSYGVVLVTASSQEEALKLADHLVKETLAACVNLFPVHSVYTWQGELHHGTEWQLVIKTNLDRFAQLEAKVQELHSYEVPEIIALPIVKGSDGYLGWLAEQTAP